MSAAIFNESWFEIDLKESRFSPTHYVYRGNMAEDGNQPRNWALQGSEDGKEFTDLKVHKDDKQVQNSQCGQWAVDEHRTPFGVSSWRYLRIQNTGSPKHLCCSGVEFYGTLTDKAGKTHEFKWVRDSSKKTSSFMYFVAEEFDRSSDDGYVLCRVPRIDLCGGDIHPWHPCRDDDKKAVQMSGDMLLKSYSDSKDLSKYVLWYGRENLIFKNITTTNLSRGDHAIGGAFFLGKKISSVDFVSNEPRIKI
jgi:hypothetical protein